MLGTLKVRKKRRWRPESLSIGAHLGNLEEGSCNGDFERWMNGALGMELLCLKRLRGGGLRVELLHWGPWKIC